MKNKYAFISKIINTATFKHSLVSFGGTAITGVFGVIFYAVVARSIGPANNGVFAVAISTIALLASVSNIGLDTGLLKFVSGNIKKNPQKAFKVMKLTISLKLAIWLSLLIVGWISMPVVVMALFNKVELITPLRIALFGVGATLFSSFVTTLFQAYSRFYLWSLVNISSNAVRLLLVFILIWTVGLTVNNAILAYSAVLFGVFVFGLFKLPVFFNAKNSNTVFSEFMNFNKWIAFFTIIAAIASRIDTYVATYYLSLSEVGIYSVGVSLVGFVTQIVLALASVVAPKLTQKNPKEFITYFKKLQAFVLLLALGGVLVGIPIGSVMIPLVYGSAYTASVLPFSILLIGNALFLVAVPVHTSVIYYFSYPKLFVYVTAIRLILTASIGVILVPQYGALGAAISVLIGNASDLLIPAVWVYRKLKV